MSSSLDYRFRDDANHNPDKIQVSETDIKNFSQFYTFANAKG